CSPAQQAGAAAIHLDPWSPKGSSDRPGGTDGPSAPVLRPASPCTVLLRVGFAEPPPSRVELVSSCLTVSPSPATSPSPAVCFLLPFPPLARRCRWQPPCPAEPGLSSRRLRRRATARPPPAHDAPCSFFRGPLRSPVDDALAVRAHVHLLVALDDVAELRR